MFDDYFEQNKTIEEKVEDEKVEEETVEEEKATENNLEEEKKIQNFYTSIKVIGVGGGGNNAVDAMYYHKIPGVELYAMNTDGQHLDRIHADFKISLGTNSTKGLGAGAIPEKGREAAEENAKEIANAVRGANMVFISAGMGGGTGTGAAPVIAKICKDMGILTVAIVTRPFTFEGKTRSNNAIKGLQDLRPNVDSLIIINNDELLHLHGHLKSDNAFAQVDEVLCHSVQTIASTICSSSRINLDFADVRTIMQDKGTALIGVGYGSGEHRASDAARGAIKSPLLEADVTGAKNAIINITYTDEVIMFDYEEAANIVKEATQNPDINIIFGTTKDESMKNWKEPCEMMVTVIATEFGSGDLKTQDNVIKEGNNINELNDQDLTHVDINAMDDEPKEEVIEEPVQEIKEEEIVEEEKEVKTKKFWPSFFRKRGKK